MTRDDSERTTVLIVDDEPDLAATFAAWLDHEYDVQEANDVDSARAYLDTADVILLDRKMPGTSGDELLDEIDERGLDVQVGMLTAVDPDVSVIDMPFDDYATKPIGRDGLRSLVESLERRLAYGEQVQELYAVATKRAALLDTLDEAELSESSKFADLTARFEKLRERTDESLQSFRSDYEAALKTATGEQHD